MGRPTQPPDLLHHAPLARGDRDMMRELVVFAYETGDSAPFERAVKHMPLGETAWDSKAVSRHLFLHDLCEACFPLVVDGVDQKPELGHLARVIGRPPSDPRDVALRQGILRELTGHARARGQLESVYVHLQKLRGTLEESTFGQNIGVRRKLGILSELRDAIDTMADGFEDCESGLRRIRDFGERLRAEDAYGRLTELLDYEEHLATLDVRLRLGYDGRVRGLQLLAVRENDANSFVPGPVRRFFRRLWRVFRGYRFGEDEVLLRFVDEVFFAYRDAVGECLALIGQLEPYLAALGFRDLAGSKGLEVCLPEVVPAPAGEGDAQAERRLEGVFNPLLLLQGITPVPCDLPTDRHDAIVILTGPNSGGKTRLLQGLALVQLLGQGGFFVPASSARLVRAPTMFVSVVDDVAAEQREGRLGTELLRIRRLFEQLDDSSFVVLDELCSGTNPSEGEVIFQMVIGLLPRLRPQVFITTHFLDLAARLEKEPPVDALEFMQVELDDDRQPTFRFVPGVAETSLAQQVAERLGVTQHELEALVEGRRKTDPTAEAEQEGSPSSSRPIAEDKRRAGSDGPPSGG